MATLAQPDVRRPNIPSADVQLPAVRDYEEVDNESAATLRPTGEGDFALACDPEVEIATYTTVLNSSSFRALPRFPMPVHIIAADPAPPTRA